MHCPEPIDLSAFVDGELTEKKQKEIQEHAVQCEGCAREIASLRDLTSRLQKLPLEQYHLCFSFDSVKRKTLWIKPAIVVCLLLATLGVSYCLESIQLHRHLEQLGELKIEHALGEQLQVRSYGLFGN